MNSKGLIQVLPSKPWSNYESLVRALGERREVRPSSDMALLEAIGFVVHDDQYAANSSYLLTDVGNSYFRLRFVREDLGASALVLQRQLRCYSPARSILNEFAGSHSISRGQIDVLLRAKGYGSELTERKVSALLTLMRRAGLVEYKGANGPVRVAQHLDHDQGEGYRHLSTLVSPSTPFSNRRLVIDALERCEGVVFWFDKHFLTAGFDMLWRAVLDPSVADVRFLSLPLSDNNGRRSRREYRNIQRELADRGISVRWRTIESQSVTNVHDRWIIGENIAFNVPNVNAVLSGQYSEVSQSFEHDRLRQLFEELWVLACDVFDESHALMSPELGQHA